MDGTQHMARIRRSACPSAKQPYDLIIDSQGLVKSAFWCRVAHGPSIGYDSASGRDPLAAWFYDQTLRISLQQHAIDRNRQLMAQALGYALANTGPDYGLQGLTNRLPAVDIKLPANSVFGLHGTSARTSSGPQITG